MSDPLKQWLLDQAALQVEERENLSCPVCGTVCEIRFGRHSSTFQVYHGLTAKPCAFNNTYAMISNAVSPREAADLFAEGKREYREALR